MQNSEGGAKFFFNIFMGYEKIKSNFHQTQLSLLSWGTEIFLSFENFTPPWYPALKMTGP